MNRSAAAGVALLHGAALATLLWQGAQTSHALRTASRQAPALLQLRLLPMPEQPTQHLAPVPPLARPPSLPAPPRPALVAPPALTLAAEPAAAPAERPAVGSTPAPTARPAEAATAVVAQADIEEPRWQPAALPPEHGSCSARGMARHYPALLRERGIEGLVMLRVQVDPQGRAAEVVVQNGSGWRLLDEAARQVALACPYLPARRGEQRLTAWVEYPLRFVLHHAP